MAGGVKEVLEVLPEGHGSLETPLTEQDAKGDSLTEGPVGLRLGHLFP